MKTALLLVSLTAVTLCALSDGSVSMARGLSSGLGVNDPGAILSRQMRDWQLQQREPWINRPLCQSDWQEPYEDLIHYDDALAEHLNLPKSPPWQTQLKASCQPGSSNPAKNYLAVDLSIQSVTVQPVNVESKSVEPVSITPQQVLPVDVQAQQISPPNFDPVNIPPQQAIPVTIQPIHIP